MHPIKAVVIRSERHLSIRSALDKVAVFFVLLGIYVVCHVDEYARIVYCALTRQLADWVALLTLLTLFGMEKHFPQAAEKFAARLFED
jgi:hypothetical protein